MLSGLGVLSRLSFISYSLKSSSLTEPRLATYIHSTWTLRIIDFLVDVLFLNLKSSKAQFYDVKVVSLVKTLGQLKYVF